MSLKKNILPLSALHGFLGHPADFKVLDIPLRAPHIFLTQLGSLEDWAQRFNRSLTQKTVALGYSMGGRLLLHALLQNPELYHGAIIVAAHPGIKDKMLRYKRLEQDRLWSEKFKNSPWDSLMHEWENTPALKGSVAIRRREGDYNRAILASAMRSFSLGTQSYLIPHLNEANLPILWISREQELENSKGLHLKHTLSERYSIIGSHRFIFEQPRLVGGLIRKFIVKLMS